ncbi:MAG: hypothetical protein ACE5HW_02140 [Candidatus Methanofastidiosia archaeon]
MRFLSNAWSAELKISEEKVMESFYNALRELGIEPKIFTEGTTFGFLIKEFRLENGKILVYSYSGKTIIEIGLSGKELKKIARKFVEKLERKPYGRFDFSEKKKWEYLIGN